MNTSHMPACLFFFFFFKVHFQKLLKPTSPFSFAKLLYLFLEKNFDFIFEYSTKEIVLSAAHPRFSNYTRYKHLSVSILLQFFLIFKLKIPFLLLLLLYASFLLLVDLVTSTPIKGERPSSPSQGSTPVQSNALPKTKPIGMVKCVDHNVTTDSNNVPAKSGDTSPSVQRQHSLHGVPAKSVQNKSLAQKPLGPVKGIARSVSVSGAPTETGTVEKTPGR